MIEKQKIIASGGIAKRLLTRGHIVCSCKPKKENSKETCFIFYRDKFFDKDVHEIMNKLTNDTQAITERLQSLQISETEYRKNIFNEYISEN